MKNIKRKIIAVILIIDMIICAVISETLFVRMLRERLEMGVFHFIGTLILIIVELCLIVMCILILIWQHKNKQN